VTGLIISTVIVMDLDPPVPEQVSV
jgi:hypothetical protein